MALLGTPTIAHHYQLCVETFRLLCNALEYAQPRFLEQLAPPKLHAELGRLRVWAGNLGAHHVGRSSLDHRLRQAGHMRQRAIGLLDDLRGNLRDGLAIITNERLPYDEQQSESDESDSSSGSGELGSSTELEQIFDDTTRIVSYLYDLAIAVRNPTPIDRFQKAIDTSHFEFWDIKHVSQRFPMLEAANPLLLQRLGKANSRRRQIFRYNRIHNDKLKHGVDALVSRVEPVPMFAAHYGEQQETATSVGSRGQDEINRSTSSHAAPTLTTETTIATFIESKTDEMELDHDDGLSETSSAASEGPLDEEDSKLRLPEPPSGALEGGFFECPYCFEIAKTPSSSKWRKHLYQDLQPYTCTFGDCPDPNKTYGSRREWFDHEAHTHRTQWTCQMCRQNYTSKQGFVEHRRLQHSASSADSQLPAILEMCARPADKGHVGKCSLCFTDGQSLLTHMAHHMLSLALFTLPLQDDKELGDGGSNKVQGEASKGLSVVDQRQTASSDSDVMSEISEDIEQEGTDDTGLSGEELNFTASIESAQISNLAIEQGIVKGQDDDFWDRAFQISRRQDSWLPYEELLTQQMKGRAPPAVMAVMNGSQRDRIMSKLVVEKANMIEKAAWENQTAALVRVVAALLLVRERLSSGATTDPHSALAWAGVCLLLPLALDGYIDSTGFVDIFDDAGIDEGLECMSGLIIRLSVIQHIYQQNADVALSLSNDDKKRKETFESQMTKVCSQILNFQAQAVHQILQKKVAADQSLLPKLTLDLKELDAACQESYSVVDTVKVKATLAQQEFRMKELVRLQGSQWPEQKKAPRGSRESGPVSAPTRDEQWSLSACLQVLRNGAYESGKDRYPDRASGTCQWVLKHSAYSGWLENGSSKILWINAAAGYGKSVLLRSLVDGELRSTTLATSCYFFFSEDSIDRRSATGALSTLLYQLCSRNRDLLVKANEAFRLNGYKITRSLPWLWNLLTSLAQCPEAGRVICLLDALDECEETGRKGLIAGLNELHSKPNEHDSQLRFLVTSRPIVSIERQFDSNILRLSGDSERGAIKQEIERVISDRVPCIAVEKALDTELQSVIEARLLRTPNPTQLWLHLVIAAILQAADVNNPRQVARFIECLPENTNAAYKALVKLSPQPEQASKLLHVVASAVRPLTLREINITLNIQDGHKAREEIQRQPEQGFSEYINDLCDPYIGVYQGKVYAGHPTVKEWWAPADRLNASSKYWAHPPITTRSDRILAELCLMYLSLDVFKDDPLGTDTTESGIHDGSEDWYENRRVQVLENARTHDFLEYASIYWIRHLRRSEYDPLLLERWNSICEPQSNRFRMWFRIFWYGNGMKNNLEWTYKIPQFTPLAFAAYLGDIAMARRLIEKGENLETRVGHGWPPLLTAINQGDEAMTIFLIEQGASFSSEGVEEWTPLGLAATRGFQKIADYLIDRGANVEQKTRIRGITALQRASATGHIAIATTLLRNGAGIDTQDSKGATALLDIASTGRILVAEMLIDNGADIGACDYRGSTALHYATRNCQDNLAQMLLEHGIEVDVRDEQERTPLSWAAEHGLHGTTKALIAGGADVDAVDEEGLTPLLYAIKYCHGIIAQELLTMGADVNTSNEEEQTALVCAVRQNDQKMVQTLLKSGPDPNIADQDGQTPLMHATGFQKGFGPVTIIQMLLEAGAEINATDHRGRTALSYAIERSQAPVIRALLDANANANIVDKDLRAPLHHAVICRPSSITQLLVEAGADVNLRDSEGNTPLELAEQKRNRYGPRNAKLLGSLLSAE